MASVSNRRIVSILLQEKLAQVNAAVSPLYSVASGWTCNALDTDLPPESEIKGVLDGYAAFAIPGLNTREAVQDLMNSDGTVDGIFPVPSTTFVVPFGFGGQIYAPMEQSLGFGVALRARRVTVYVQFSGTTGVNLQLDLLSNGATMLTAPISVPVGSGQNLNVIVPDSQISTTSLPAASVITARIIAAPDDAANVTLNLWLTS